MIKINGDVFNFGENIQTMNVQNNNVIINDKRIDLPDSKNIKIEITGNVEQLECDVTNSIKITGNVTDYVKTVNGDVEIKGYVGGNVSTTNGDVECGDINGSVKTTNGDILRK